MNNQESLENCKYICKNCGRIIPIYCSLVIIQPWNWKAILSFFVDDVKVECPFCNSDLNIPIILFFYNPSEKIFYAVIDEKIKNSLGIEPFKKAFQKEYSNAEKFEICNSIEELKNIIGTFILSYKQLLKELLIEKQGENFFEYVKKNWQKLTPSLFSSGIVAASGIIKGIGSTAINPSTGEQLSFNESFDALKRTYSEIQLSVWLVLINYIEFSEEYDFEKALVENIVEFGILDNSFDKLMEILSLLKENKATTFRTWYSALALYATVASLEKKENIFLNEWSYNYYLFESFLEKEENKNSGFRYLKISDQRATKTITEKAAWQAITTIINENIKTDIKFSLHNLVKTLEQISNQLGYKDLVLRVLKYFNVQGEVEDVFSLIIYTLNYSDIKNSPETQIQLLRQNIYLLIRGNNSEVIDKLFDYMIPLCEGNIELIAHLESWYGECMKELRQPNKFINLVGENPREWEYNLSIERKLDLWNERANAFRLLGKPNLSLDITEKLFNEIKDKENLDFQKFILQRNRAILLREVGSLDASYVQFLKLIERCPIEQLSFILQSFASTCNLLGKYDIAVQELEKAREFNIHQSEVSKLKFEAALALQYTMVKKYKEALEILDNLDNKNLPFEISTLMVGSYYNLLTMGVNLNESQFDNLGNLISLCKKELQAMHDAGDLHLELQVLGSLADIYFYIDEGESENLLIQKIELQKKHSVPLSTKALVKLCTIAYRKKKFTVAKLLLRDISKSLAENFGTIKDLYLTYNATIYIRNPLNELLNAAIDNNANWAEVRSILELQRGTIGLAKLIKDKNEEHYQSPLLEVELTDEYLLILKPDLGNRAIIEMIDYNEEILFLVTIISSNGNLYTKVIESPSIDLFFLRKKITQRLSVWHSQRPGDPFDFDEWSNLEEWLNNQFNELLKTEDQIIIINHQFLNGIPWHVALSHKWKCSYSPSWRVLLDQNSNFPRDDFHLGIFATERFGDNQKVTESIHNSVTKTKRWASKNGFRKRIIEKELADKNSFSKLMMDCDIVKIICHGYAAPGDLEIAFIVSANNALSPLLLSRIKGGNNSNLLSWKEMQALSDSPSIIFSAACSTGIQWMEGLNEQLGLFGALYNSGTKVVIAPQWDISAIEVLPILDEILFRFVDEKIPLVDAVYQACKNASLTLPRWLAWSLTYEGGLIQ